jgi:hypothetical protein
MWINLHPRLTEWCLALAPLRLTSYIVLWILDWIPPMTFRWYDGEHRPHDRNHLLKLRLIEGVMKSYSAIRP